LLPRPAGLDRALLRSLIFFLSASLLCHIFS
jgi:hypothetical protein